MPNDLTSSSRRIGVQPLDRLAAAIPSVSMRAMLGRDRELGRCRSQIKERPERRRLEQAPFRAVRQLELGEDRARFRGPGGLARLPLTGEPVAQLVESRDRVEYPTHDELRGN